MAFRRALTLGADGRAQQLQAADTYQYFTDPTLPTWAWVNQVNSTVANSCGGIYLSNTAVAGGSASANVRVKSAPATPYHAEFAWLPNYKQAVNCFAGSCLRESATGKLLLFSLGNVSSTGALGGTCLRVFRYTSPTVVSATSLNLDWALGQTSLQWMRLGNSGTALTCDVCTDGNHWLQMYTELKAAFFTTGPDQLGFFQDSSTQVFGMTLLSYKETS